MMKPRHSRRAAMAAALVSAAMVAACGRQAPLHGMSVADAQAAPALVLRDSKGQLFDLAAERGKAVLVFFGYTHCPDVCPTTLADFARARRILGVKPERLRLVFVSVDPERDTPALTESYAWQFDSTFTGLAPTAAQLDTIKGAWGFAVEKETMPGMAGYGVTHPAGVFFVDRDGKVRFVFAPGTKGEDLAADLRRLL
ncbi:MAG: SCO family protein [Gemmatimonadales bacterium]